MRHDDVPVPPAASIGRRAVVVGATAVGIGGLVAGCGGAQDSGALGPVGAPVGAAGTPLGAAAEVPVGGGTIFEALEVVVTQPEPGDFRGFSAVCTHTGCIVDEVVDGTINCPCHGSRYRLDGTVAAGPAPRALPSRPVTVVDGRLVLS